MFYPVESLRRGGRFYLCWVADSWPLRFATITHRQLWSQDIREICNDLLEVMKNESGRPTNRFSLRLSSQLLRGLVRLYQRKVTVFVGDLCMINAHVMKISHKKSNYEEIDNITRSPVLPMLSKFILEMQPEEEALEEKIQNNGNIVAHIEDITLRESTLPGNKNILDDGFGELHPDQLLQLVLGERSVETMLFKETSAQLSAIDLPLDFSADKSHDKSRLNLREAQMERLSEHDISVFGKSIVEGMVLGDLEKEIPEITDLPHPDPPHTDKESEKGKQKGKDNEKSKQTMIDEIVLEELEKEPPVKRRKVRNKLMIDEKIKLTSDYIRSRLDNNKVETRPEPMLAQPGRQTAPLAGPARPLGASLAAMHGDMLRRLDARAGDTPAGDTRTEDARAGDTRAGDTRAGDTRAGDTRAGDTRAGDTRAAQEVLLYEKRHSNVRPVLEKIDEEMGAAVENYEGNFELRDVSKRMDITDAILEVPVECITGATAAAAAVSMQEPLKTRRPEKRVGEEQESPKKRRSGYFSLRHEQQKSSELSALEINEENVPSHRDPSALLTALLQRHGLADSEAAYGGEEHPPGREEHTPAREGHASEGVRRVPEESRASETPLGSLDRTKVSLGDSEHTTDSKKFIREEWGTQGAMHKIYRCIKSGSSPVDVRSLMSKGPVLSGHRRLIAARCFTSILKLKQHGFIKIYKDSETSEIKDIKFGSKIVRDE